MKMIEKKDSIIDTLKNAKGNSLDIYSDLYKRCVDNKENAPRILQEILEYPDEIGVDDNASRVVSKDHEDKFKKMYTQLLLDETEALVKENLPREEFYQKLWEKIFESDTAPDTDEKGAVCIKILNETVPWLPYYQAQGLIQMEDEEFGNRIQSITPCIQESIHMLNRRFEQKTEEASQFCRIIRSLDEKDATVYLATLLNILRKAYMEQGARKAAKESTE